MTAFLRKVSVRCKIFVGKIFLQHVKNCKYLCCEIFYENEKIIEQNITKFAQILGNLKSTFKSNLVQKFSIIKVT
jgi:GTPase involved in cell partitioning and DNA repair